MLVDIKWELAVILRALMLRIERRGCLISTSCLAELCVFWRLFTHEDTVILIIRNLNLISVQSWTYLLVWLRHCAYAPADNPASYFHNEKSDSRFFLVFISMGLRSCGQKKGPPCSIMKTVIEKKKTSHSASKDCSNVDFSACQQGTVNKFNCSRLDN